MENVIEIALIVLLLGWLIGAVIFSVRKKGKCTAGSCTGCAYKNECHKKVNGSKAKSKE